ncbi:MAG: ABC transporter permease [Lachnospiraceae bacterium]|nr:ABC transporter permease [Lachnospiraceae bacterium]
MKSLVFAKRTIKEIMRDPLSYIFCLGFPMVMLVIMSIVDQSIPTQANMTVFHIENLGPGIAYFGLTFIMLFTGIQVSKDRSTALLLRLYASPMKPTDYILGYTLPVTLLAIVQMAICFVASFIIGIFTGYTFGIDAILLSMIALLPSVFLFAGIGFLFGSIVNEKAAPGLCSIIITITGMVGGIWMDIDGLGGVIKKVADVLPFYHGVTLAKLPFRESSDGVIEHLIWTVGCALIVYVLSVVVFRSKMKKDVK